MEQFKTKQQEINAFERSYALTKGLSQFGYPHICRKCWLETQQMINMKVLGCTETTETFQCPQCKTVKTFSR